jgi:hypothetical protein
VAYYRRRAALAKAKAAAKAKKIKAAKAKARRDEARLAKSLEPPSSEPTPLDQIEADAIDNIHVVAEQIGCSTFAPDAGVIIDNAPEVEAPAAVEQQQQPHVEPQRTAAVASENRVATTAAPSSPRLVQSEAPRQLTPAEAKLKAMEPQRQPVSNEPSTTQQALEWMGSSSGRIKPSDWGPI